MGYIFIVKGALNLPCKMMDKYNRKDGYKEDAMPDICLERIDAVVPHGMDLYYGKNFRD